MSKHGFNNAVGPEARESSKKIPYAERLVPFMLLAVFIPVGLCAATQYAASAVGYAPWLGEPVFGSIYSPLSFISWNRDYGDYFPDVFKLAKMIAFWTGIMPPLLLTVLWKVSESSKLKGNRYLHGSARWADFGDIVNASLMPKDGGSQKGVFVGGWRDQKGVKHYLRHNGPEHVLAVAPTRSGKGVGLVNPTLLTWTESAFITDIKGELWAITSGYRAKGLGQICIKFDPSTKRRATLAIRDDFPIQLKNLMTEKNMNGDTLAGKLGVTPETVTAWENGKLPGVTRVRDIARVLKVPETSLLFETGYNSSRWNPLDEIRAEGFREKYYDPETGKLEERVCDGSMEQSDVVTIANMLVDPKGEGTEKLDFWGKSALALINAAIIHLKHNLPEACTLANVYRLLNGQIDTARHRSKKGSALRLPPEAPLGIKDVYADMMLGLDCNGKTYNAARIVSAEGKEMSEAPDEQAGSTLSTAKTFLQTYSEQIIDENTSASDFHISEIMNSEKPVSLYLVVSPAKKDDMKPLIRLLITLMITKNCAEMSFKGGRSVQGYAHRCLLMLDEFPSWGQLDKVKEGIAYMAGYGLKGYFICQDMNQLQDIYGQKESISSNCHIQIFYAPLNVETARIMSDKIGTTTILKESVSISGSGLKASKSRSMQETSRPLLTADECMQLPSPEKDNNGNILKAGAMIIIEAGYPAIYGEQVLYFKDRLLMDRAKIEAPETSGVIVQKKEDGITAAELLEDRKQKGNAQS